MMNKKGLIVITGASSGIGEACAKMFNQLGYPLLLLARRKEILESFNLTNCLCMQVDVINFEQVDSAIKQAVELYGPVDLLINNAGIMALDYLVNLDLKTQYDMVDINIKGILNTIHSVLPIMIKQKQGTIINVSSVAGRYSSETRTVYNATKYAVHGLSEALRKEAANDNIRVIIFAPGIVDTNLLKSVVNKDILESYQKVKDTINQGLTSQEVSDIIGYAYQLPQHVCLKEIVLSHTGQKI